MSFYILIFAVPSIFVDYAHDTTGFLTWHRQYLLWFEWEIQYMLKSMNRQDYHTFRLSYWDWRYSMQTESNSPFKHNRLGMTVESEDTARLPIVKGRLFNHGWNTICWFPEIMPNFTIAEPVCNPNMPGRVLQRCSTVSQGDPSPCAYNNPNWPRIQDVNDALMESKYDVSPYDVFSNGGFRNSLEGFQIVDSDCNAETDRFCGQFPGTNTFVNVTLHIAVSLVLLN